MTQKEKEAIYSQIVAMWQTVNWKSDWAKDVAFENIRRLNLALFPPPKPPKKRIYNPATKSVSPPFKVITLRSTAKPPKKKSRKRK